jgi:DNA-directed RNA polymerase subunit RPC12/RpoP
MAVPPSNKQTFLCPSCGAKFEFGATMAGRSAKCQRCGHLFTVPKSATSSDRTAETKSEERVGKSMPEFVGVSCRVCQTRLFGRLNQVGQPLKCPDCGAQTILQPPVPEKAKSLPAALEGEQYELWDADAAPLPSDLIAAQPKYIAVICRSCRTLMHATEDQIGQELTCPDCRTRNLVVPPAEPKAPRSVLVPDHEAYQLDEAFAPTERPAVIQTQYKGMLHEQEREAEVAREDEKVARGKKPRRQTDVRGRPILPRWPLLTGIVPFLFSRGVPVRWLTLSAVAALGAVLALFGVGSIGAGGGGSAGQLSAMGGVCFLAIACIIGILWSAALASVIITIVTESSEGNDQIQHWPPPGPAEWFPELIYVLMAAFVSAFPGWLIAQFVTPDATERALWTAGSVLFCFPVAILSQLDINSPFAVLSGKVLASLVRCPFSWLLFYLESGLLAAGCVLVAPFAKGALQLVVTLPPLSIAAALLYSRLLGRLAWKLAETMPSADASDSGET